MRPVNLILSKVKCLADHETCMQCVQNMTCEVGNEVPAISRQIVNFVRQCNGNWMLDCPKNVNFGGECPELVCGNLDVCPEGGRYACIGTVYCVDGCEHSYQCPECWHVFSYPGEPGDTSDLNRICPTCEEKRQKEEDAYQMRQMAYRISAERARHELEFRITCHYDDSRCSRCEAAEECHDNIPF